MIDQGKVKVLEDFDEFKDFPIATHPIFYLTVSVKSQISGLDAYLSDRD